MISQGKKLKKWQHEVNNELHILKNLLANLGRK
jgi:hypothetical protein